MNKYSIVACDLDGTLLGSDMKVSEENLNAIRELVARGVEFVPCTGRTICEMREVVDIPEIRYIIYSNGAAVYDKKTKTYITMCISNEQAENILDVVSKFNSYVITHYDGQTYVSSTDEAVYDELNLNDTIRELATDYAIEEKNIRARASTAKHIEAIVVCFDTDEEKERCKEVLFQDKTLRVVEGLEREIEIFCVDAGKGNALEKLAEKIDISRENIMAIGDSGNDITMIKYAGLGLVAGNGSDEVKAHADKVICTNDEHVAKYVLENYFD